MKVREMYLYWCEICWACVVLCGLAWVFMTVIALILLFAGVWAGVAWVGGASVLYGGLVFMIGYLEARRHWKLKEGK